MREQDTRTRRVPPQRCGGTRLVLCGPAGPGQTGARARAGPAGDRR